MNSYTTLKRSKGMRPVRTEIAHIRLEPRMRFAAELGARFQKCSISSFIERALSNFLNTIQVPYWVARHAEGKRDKDYEFNEFIDRLWHADEVMRFIKMAQIAPSLLDHEEEFIWEFVQREECFWLPPTQNQPREPIIEVIRDAWPDLLSYAKTGEFDSTKLRDSIMHHAHFKSEATRQRFMEVWHVMWPTSSNSNSET